MVLHVRLSGSVHWVPQPFEQHLDVPLQARSELHSKSQKEELAGTKYGHCPPFRGKQAGTGGQ